MKIKISFALLIIEANDLRVALVRDHTMQLEFLSIEVNEKFHNNKSIDTLANETVKKILGFDLQVKQFNTCGIYEKTIEIIYYGTIPYQQIKDIDMDVFDTFWISVLREYPPRLKSQYKQALTSLKQQYNFTPTY